MSQNILTVKVDSFRQQVSTLNFATLKQLIEGIYDYKRKYYPTFKDQNNEIVLDLERKESIIMRELGNRGINTKNDDYQMWLKKIQNQASKIMVVKS